MTREPHTPGPWSIEYEYAAGDGQKTGATIFGADHQGQHCKCWRDADENGACWVGSRQADAELIAAAPDLLDAARCALEALEHFEDDWSDIEAGAGSELRAAIAKATGQAVSA